MAKRSPNYILVLLMLVVATGVTYWARTRPVVAASGSNLASLPAQLGEWAKYGEDSAADKEVLQSWIVESDAFLTRAYVAPDGTALTLMAVYKGFDRRGWHLSEMCFNGSGYNVTQSATRVPYAGKDVPAVKLVAVNPTEGTREIAVYFFAQGSRTEMSFGRQQMSMALTRLRPSRQGWAFVRVTSTVTISDEDTLAHIRGFLRSASGPLIKALTTPKRSAAAR